MEKNFFGFHAWTTLLGDSPEKGINALATRFLSKGYKTKLSELFDSKNDTQKGNPKGMKSAFMNALSGISASADSVLVIATYTHGDHGGLDRYDNPPYGLTGFSGCYSGNHNRLLPPESYRKYLNQTGTNQLCGTLDSVDYQRLKRSASSNAFTHSLHSRA